MRLGLVAISASPTAMRRKGEDVLKGKERKKKSFGYASKKRRLVDLKEELLHQKLIAEYSSGDV